MTSWNARGTVDGLVLAFLGRTALHAGDFVQTPQGVCRLHPQLARMLVASCRIGHDALDEMAR